MNKYQITYRGLVPTFNSNGETDLAEKTRVELFLGTEAQLMAYVTDLEQHLGNKIIGMECVDEVTVCIMPQTTETCLVLKGFEGDEYLCDMGTALILMDELGEWAWTMVEGYPSKTFQIKAHAFDNWVELYNVKRA